MEMKGSTGSQDHKGDDRASRGEEEGILNMAGTLIRCREVQRVYSFVQESEKVNEK